MLSNENCTGGVDWWCGLVDFVLNWVEGMMGNECI
jgi:hypothetical protein